MKNNGLENKTKKLEELEEGSCCSGVGKEDFDLWIVCKAILSQNGHNQFVGVGGSLRSEE
jgi:hypothetical protein